MGGLAVQKREKKENTRLLRKGGMIPGVLYGPNIQASPIKVDEKEFSKTYTQAGESSLIQVQVEGRTSPVLIREVQRDPLYEKVIHVDFYQPSLDEQIEVSVPLVFEGEAPAVKDLGGTLLRNIQEVEVRALPQNLPHEIQVEISRLATFEDRILVKDLIRSKGVEILREPEEVVAQVIETEDVETELAQPIEEKVEAVEQVEEKRGEEKEEAVSNKG